MARPYSDDDWTLATIEGGENGPSVARFRTRLPPRTEREAWVHLIIIGWAYEPRDDSGLPNPDDHERMCAFEDAMEATVEAQDAGTQAVSITGGGAREWRYYTRDTGKFLEAMNAALHGQPPYPLELDAFVDPEWDALAELLPTQK